VNRVLVIDRCAAVPYPPTGPATGSAHDDPMDANTRRITFTINLTLTPYRNGGECLSGFSVRAERRSRARARPESKHAQQ
jgi:hypothetical protein